MITPATSSRCTTPAASPPSPPPPPFISTSLGRTMVLSDGDALRPLLSDSFAGAPAGPPTAPPTGKPDSVAAVRRDFRQAIIDYTAATVDGGIYTHAAPATLSRPATQRFIFEIVKRSRATFYDLQLALFYFVRLRNAHAASTASTATTSATAKESLVPPTAATNSDLSSPPSPPTSPFAPTAPPLPLTSSPPPPRTDESHLHFLGALILSHKYLHDHALPTRAWTAIAGLPSDSVDAAERFALAGLGFALGIGDGAGFGRFCAVPVRAAMRTADVARRLERVGEAAVAAVARKRRWEGVSGERFKRGGGGGGGV
ncbi:hypothetical protein DFJ73DRAFT_869276 [Zopfochytrium polystomum]|nr:hypothetical protein DFJ73DRAFT_869276 [Zopfochytrium polystomum]